MLFIILKLSLYKKGYIKKIKFVKMRLLINLLIKKLWIYLKNEIIIGLN